MDHGNRQKISLPLCDACIFFINTGHENDHTVRCGYFYGYRGRFYMLGVGKAAPSPRQVPPFGRLRSETPLRRQCAILRFAPNLRRTRGAAQKGRWVTTTARRSVCPSAAPASFLSTQGKNGSSCFAGAAVFNGGRPRGAARNKPYAFCSLGKRRRTVVPFPGALSNSTWALWRAAPCLTMDRPRPVPPMALEWLLSTR